MTRTASRSTAISWTQHTINPFVGCSIVSPGCTNCYAMRVAQRLESFGQPSYQGTTRTANGNPIWSGRINRASAATMRKPFAIKEPSIFFVNSMSDYFHPAALDAWRIEFLGVMAACDHHQFQVLTKRPENILPFLERHTIALPRNVWIGATVERHDFNHRIDILRRVPAHIRFLSIEPLIGDPGEMDLTDIQWVILGGESGPGARAMKLEWARSVRDQCLEQGVPLYFKQFGLSSNNPIYHEPPDKRCSLTGAARVSKLDPNEKGGCTLDGRQWHEYPSFEVQRPLL